MVDKLDVLNVVSRRTGVLMSDIMGRSRRWDIVNARQLASVCFRELKWSYPAIGNVLGRHHTSIIHLVKSADDEMYELASDCVAQMHEMAFTLRYIPQTSFSDRSAWLVGNPRTNTEVTLPDELAQELSEVLTLEDLQP